MEDKMTEEYFPQLTNELIENRLICLADNQRRRFEEEVMSGKDRRHALFIALSIPIEVK